MSVWQSLLSGSMMMGLFTVSLFFLKFWRKTTDIFFLVFSASFALMGVERLVLAMYHDSEFKPFVYVLRLFAFLLILVAIIHKNLSDNKSIK